MQSLRLRLTVTTAAIALSSAPALAQTAPAQSTDPSTSGAPTPPAATAQGLQPGQAIKLEEIIVTANKRAERARDVANSVTAISGEELQKREEVRLQDIVSQVPGLSLEEDNPTALRIVLRGLNSGSVGATVASVIDDVPANPSNGIVNGSISTPNFNTYDLQRLEVLRGPQGTLYGATAEGGLIKYVTNAPDPTEYYGSVETGVSGIDGGSIGGSFKGFVNAPIIKDKLAFRLSGTIEWIPGYIENPLLGEADTNTARQYSYRASLLGKPTEELTVRLFGSYQSTFVDNINQVEAIGAALTPAAAPPNQLALVNGLRKNDYFPNATRYQAGTYYIGLDYDLHFATVTSLTSYVTNHGFATSDVGIADAAPGVPFTTAFQGIYGQPARPVEHEVDITDKFNQELRLTSKSPIELPLVGGGLDYQAGGFFTYENGSLSQRFDVLDAGLAKVLQPAAGGAGITNSLSEWAAFGQLDYHVTSTIDVAAGGRYGGNTQHSQTTLLPGLLTTGSGAGPNIVQPVLRSGNHDATYSVAPRWRINEDTLIYARLATGYRPGGPNSPLPGLPAAATYKSDKTVNWEAGLRQDFFDKSVTADLTFFNINWHSVQILTNGTTSFGTNATFLGNGGTATTRGGEWSFAWKPLAGLKLSDVGAYADARLTENAPGVGGLDGQQLPFVPALTNSVNIDYSWPVFGDYEAFVSGTWTHTGSRYTGFGVSPALVTHVRLPSYETGALRGGVENGRYTVEFFVNNISDERGIANYTSEGGFANAGLLTLIQPRTFGATLRANF